MDVFNHDQVLLKHQNLNNIFRPMILQKSLWQKQNTGVTSVLSMVYNAHEPSRSAFEFLSYEFEAGYLIFVADVKAGTLSFFIYFIFM